MSPLFIGLKDVSLKDVGLKDVSLKDVVVPKGEIMHTILNRWLMDETNCKGTIAFKGSD